MSVNLLRASCGVAEFRGTSHHFTDQVLQNYVRERNSTDAASAGYSNKQHTFVVMVFVKGFAEDFDDYVKAHQLGEIVSSEYRENINHSGLWLPKGSGNGRELRVVVFTPNHQKLTEWYQEKYDKDYQL